MVTVILPISNIIVEETTTNAGKGGKIFASNNKNITAIATPAKVNPHTVVKL